MKQESILSSFQNVLLTKSNDYGNFLRKFNLLYDELSLNMKDISAFTNFDTSFLYRFKSGERKTSDLPAFCDKISKYLVSSYSSLESKDKVAYLLGISYHDISEEKAYYTAVYKWLLSGGNHTEHSTAKPAKSAVDISRFLIKMDEFDLEDYIKVIHFDEIKVPSIPFHFPSTRTYYGISKMREGELDFFKTTVTAKATEPIFMHSDMTMLDMAEDMDFNRKWMFAIACSIKKGLHLNYVSGAAALCGEAIEGAPLDGKYTLTNNKEEIAYYQKKAKHILSHAQPLMEIYDSANSSDYHSFLLKDAQTSGERKNILSSLPIYTISEALLDQILVSNRVNAADAQVIRNYRKSEIERMNQKLSCCTITDEIAIPTESAYTEHPMYLSVSGCFYEAPLLYRYEELLAHLKETQHYAKANRNYFFNLVDISAFRNIQIEIVKNQYVIVSKIKSPSIHFIIRHPQLVQALQDFTIPVID